MVNLVGRIDSGTSEEHLRDVADAPVLEETAARRRAREAVSTELLSRGAVTREGLGSAELEYAATGDPIDEILVADGGLSEDARVETLAELHGVQSVDLAASPVPDPEVSGLLARESSIAWQALPLAVTASDVVLVAVGRVPDDRRFAELENAIGHRVELLLANRVELDALLQRVHAGHLSQVAQTGLLESDPDASGHIVVTAGQRGGFITLGVVFLAALVFWPMPTVIAAIGVASFIYLIVSVYKFRLTLRAVGTRLEVEVTPEEIDALDDHELPIYSVLVPLFREASVVPDLVRALNALNYPRTRLDIKLLCEEEDDETIEAIRELHLPPQFSIVIVPESQPKTKPKACNYGIQLATGEYIVIFDAEDRPDPDQLKKAVIAFRRLPENVVCVQSKLNYFNQHQNLLTSWFSNEYAMHFELVLPAMAAVDSPIPLGGTSNHLVTETVRQLGSWDPFNVTEDADLGIRLHRLGYRTAMIDSTTLEEANSVVGNWIRQRSRWNKGYMQTWLVHMRHPLTLLHETGWRGFMSLNLTLGTTFVLLMNPIFWFLTTLYFFTRWSLIEQMFPGIIFYVASAMLFVGNFMFLFLNVIGGLQRAEFSLTRSALLSPLYWGLMSWAAWKGFIQLFTDPFYWEKTEHGLNLASARPTSPRPVVRPVASAGSRRPAVEYGGIEDLFPESTPDGDLLR